MHKAHLDIELSVLWLAVGTKVLVAKAASNLEVLFKARYHEQLFELLR